MGKIAEILINRPTKHLNRTFSYRIPERLSEAGPGYRCIVPFSRRMEEGIILSVRDDKGDTPEYKLLEIRDLVDSFPWFTEKMLLTALWISNYYLCTLIDALRLFYIDKKSIRKRTEYKILWENIPDNSDFCGMIDSSVEVLSAEDASMLLGNRLSACISKKFLEAREQVSLTHREPLERWIAPANPPDAAYLARSPKGKALFETLQKNRQVSFDTAIQQGISLSVIHTFCKKGYGRIFYRRKKTFSLVSDIRSDKSYCLTEAQKKAIAYVNQAIDRKTYEGVLLKGVTGSGKTEVYLQTALHAVRKGGTVLILVPEIALTDQLTGYFQKKFGSQVIFIHSNLSKEERYNNRLRMLRGESSIVIGSRSALFMPFDNLSLIVVDEEYDFSYKQGDGPRYNARDVAKKMATIYGCPILLGAATPSVSTYYAAKTGKIRLLEIPERVFNTPLPKIHIYDMKEESLFAPDHLLSRPLIQLLKETLNQHQKAILLLNRRGYSTALMCADCGYVFKCPHCDVPLVYHRDTEHLHCHYCDTVHPLPSFCPRCGGRNILYLGRGTQKIEEELKNILPEARARRFDLDSTRRKYSAKEILQDFRAGKFDILYGTQMVAKGHDIPDVQSVGILSIDSILNIPSYLASEQAFNLITQCAGRAGRSKIQGKVILQTYNPDHYVIQAAARQDYEAFYEKELAFRKALHYPPFVRMIKISCFHQEEQTARQKAERIYTWLCRIEAGMEEKISFTPPFAEPIKKIRDRHYISLLIKGKDLSSLRALMRDSNIFKENDIIIDVDPV